MQRKNPASVILCILSILLLGKISVSSLTAGHGMLAATRSWGEILFSTNGLDWGDKANTLQWIEDLAFTPNGIIVASFGLLAEARFDGGVDPVAPAQIKIEGKQFQFEGPLRYHEIEYSKDLGADEWTVFRRTATNAIWDTSTVFAPEGAFFRIKRSE